MSTMCGIGMDLWTQVTGSGEFTGSTLTVGLLSDEFLLKDNGATLEDYCTTLRYGDVAIIPKDSIVVLKDSTVVFKRLKWVRGSTWVVELRDHSVHS